MTKQFYEYEPTGADRELDRAERRESKLKADLATLREQVKLLREALDTIGGGYTDRFPGAPDPMAATSPESFRAAMWTWSQSVARAALAATKETI